MPPELARVRQQMRTQRAANEVRRDLHARADEGRGLANQLRDNLGVALNCDESRLLTVAWGAEMDGRASIQSREVSRRRTNCGASIVVQRLAQRLLNARNVDSCKRPLLAAPLMIVFIGSLVLLGGCGPADGLADVRGTVTLNGKPLANATIEFQPLEPGQSPSSAKTDESGNYRLMYTLSAVGVVPGKHRITISTAETCFDDEGGEYESEELVPAEYNRDSELQRTVESGRNRIDFDL